MNDQISKRFFGYNQNLVPVGIICPCPLAVYMYKIVLSLNIFLLPFYAHSNRLHFDCAYDNHGASSKKKKKKKKKKRKKKSPLRRRQILRLVRFQYASETT